MARPDRKIMEGNIPTSHIETSDDETSMTQSRQSRALVCKPGTWFSKDRKASLSSMSSTVWFSLLIADQVSISKFLPLPPS